MWLLVILLHLEQQPALSFFKVGFEEGNEVQMGSCMDC